MPEIKIPNNVFIEKLSHGGDGIARIPLRKGKDQEKFVLFVPYTVPGERVEIKTIEIRRSFARGLPVKTFGNCLERSHPPCPYYFNPDKTLWCGGCNFQHLKLQAQAKEKRLLLLDALTRIGNLMHIPVLPTLEPANENLSWQFRNKLQIPFSMEKGRIVSGFYAPHSHQIVPIEDCLIQTSTMMDIVRFVTEKLNELKISAYTETNGKGWLRHLYLRESSRDKKQLLTFVTSNDAFPKKELFLKTILDKFPLLVGILQNIQPAKTNVILGREWKRLFGQDFLTETLEGLGPNGKDLNLKVSAPSFFQVNGEMTKVLYSKIRDFLREDTQEKCDLLLDLFCGVGGIALTLAIDSKKVIAVDEIAAAISDAKENGITNSLPNCEFFREDAAHLLKKIYDQIIKMKNCCVVLDPPRSGCDPNLLTELAKLRPSKIIYVSCEPSTLARDLKLLDFKGFHCKKIQPVDMFPQSSHIESVSLLTP